MPPSIDEQIAHGIVVAVFVFSQTWFFKKGGTYGYHTSRYWHGGV
jgi:hypothetical protein